MEPVCIEYRIELGAHRTETFDFALDGKSFDLITREVLDSPRWIELGYRQCPHCPLTPEQSPHCPLALQLRDIVERFHDTKSIDQVALEVVTADRRVIQTLALQQAIASMLDLIWPTCGCPKTTNMKPLARFHLPVASEEETVFRVTGMYLLAQYFLSLTSDSARIELDGLTRIYEDSHILNTAVARRLQDVTKSDSVKNAITLIDMYSMLVPVLLEDQLAEMRGFFKAYLPEGGTVGAKTNHLEQAKAFRLELVPLEGKSAIEDNRPDWMRALEPEDTAQECLSSKSRDDTEAQKSKAIEDILSRSTLRLELEPIGNETAPEAEGQPVSRISVFKQADD